MKLIVYSIPIFFLLIVVEVIISYLRKSELYSFSDAMTNISCGITQQVSNVFINAILFLAYLYLYNEFKFITIPDNIWTYIILFIAVDFLYYWFHRMAHEISVFWGTHIVHHQSEEYNFSVALRQSSFQTFISSAFYLPLALIGFNPISFITISALQTLYQFWIHTKTIDKLPRFFEYFLNTPSHHRVHHGRNPKYIDKNHGGTLIIFDRMFGTFQAEEEAVIYGVTKNLNSWNPVWANFDYYVDLIEDLRRPMKWTDRFRMLVKKPGWLPDYLGGYRAPPAISEQDITKYKTVNNNKLSYYILIQFAITLGLASYFLNNVTSFDWAPRIIFAVLIIFSVSIFGGLFEHKKWAVYSEFIRPFVFIAFGFYLTQLFSLSSIYMILIAVIFILSFIYFYVVRQVIPAKLTDELIS